MQKDGMEAFPKSRVLSLKDMVFIGNALWRDEPSNALVTQGRACEN
jgi:hypothetical protein